VKVDHSRGRPIRRVEHDCFGRIVGRAFAAGAHDCNGTLRGAHGRYNPLHRACSRRTIVPL